MKNLTLAAVFAVAALPAFSGNLSEPVVEPSVIEAETVATDHQWVGLMLLGLVVAAAVSN